jgi:hypothetical protein
MMYLLRGNDLLIVDNSHYNDCRGKREGEYPAALLVSGRDGLAVGDRSPFIAFSTTVPTTVAKGPYNS